jgi:hypothetical protein
MFHNVVIGKPLIEPWVLLAHDRQDWLETEEKDTLFTDTRFLPAIMKEAGIVSSTGEVRRNRPEYCINLNEVDCVNVKWGKKRLYIIVGE